MNFVLKEFNRTDNLSLNFTGSISRNKNILDVTYTLSGDLSTVSLPVQITRPLRKDNLWKETCFELFFKDQQKENYWETNLSPSGNWNLYKFNSYRKDMNEERLIQNIPNKVSSSGTSYSINFQINCSSLFPVTTKLSIGTSSVIKLFSGQISYWALTHLNQEPDFHNSQGFLIVL